MTGVVESDLLLLLLLCDVTPLNANMEVAIEATVPESVLELSIVDNEITTTPATFNLPSSVCSEPVTEPIYNKMRILLSTRK